MSVTIRARKVKPQPVAKSSEGAPFPSRPCVTVLFSHVESRSFHLGQDFGARACLADRAGEYTHSLPQPTKKGDASTCSRPPFALLVVTIRNRCRREKSDENGHASLYARPRIGSGAIFRIGSTVSARQFVAVRGMVQLQVVHLPTQGPKRKRGMMLPPPLARRANISCNECRQGKTTPEMIRRSVAPRGPGSA
jgi:hypothetical protein